MKITSQASHYILMYCLCVSCTMLSHQNEQTKAFMFQVRIGEQWMDNCETVALLREAGLMPCGRCAGGPEAASSSEPPPLALVLLVCREM